MYQETVVSSTEDGAALLDGADDEVYFEDFERQLADNAVSHVVTSEHFLLEFIQSKMDLGMYDYVIQVLKQIDVVDSPKFLQFWDEAHYKKQQEDRNTKLTALQKYRIRRRNTPPRGICGGGERPNFRLSREARALLDEWFRRHIKHPYPSRKTKDALSQQAGVTLNQINTWFANARRKKRKQISQSVATTCSTKFISWSGKIQRPTTSLNKPIMIHNSCQRLHFIHSSLKENETTGVSGCALGESFNNPATISTPTGSTGCRNRSLKEIQLSNLQQSEHMKYLNTMRDQKLKHTHGYGQYFTTAGKPVLDNSKPKTALSNSLTQPPRRNSVFVTGQQKSFVLHRLQEKLKKEGLETTIMCNGDCAIAKESLNALSNLCDKLETTIISPIDFAKTVHIDVLDSENDVQNYSRMEDCTQWGSKTCGKEYGCTLESPLTQSARATIPGFSNDTPRTKSTSESMIGTTFPGGLLLQEDDNIWQPSISNVMTDISQPIAATYTMGSMFEDQNEDQVDQSTIDSSLLEESYGTIIGEAIQGLLNLSSQESD